MDISKISKAYELNDLEVVPDQLLLDPHNPRIAIDMEDELTYVPNELASVETQEYILSVINKSEHHIKELIRGLRTSGFLSGGSPIIVKNVYNRNKYLILEGNRRLTAIKHLLNERDKLNPTVLDTFQKLTVKEFIYNSDSTLSEEETIDILLGSIHIKGPLQWGPIEKAFYIYKAYIRELQKNYGKEVDFFYVKSFAEKAALFFNFKTNEVKKLLTIYRVYEQLKYNSYPVRQDHYSLIELAISNRDLNKAFFELDQHFNFSKEGLDNFANLCISDNRPISNPKLFQSFVKIYKNGTGNEVNMIVEHNASIDITLLKINNRLKKKTFIDQLKKIKSLLDGLVIADYQATIKEDTVVKEIKDIVKHRLSPLTRISKKKGAGKSLFRD